MAYSTSSEVNRTDVMDRIKLFAQAQGYSHSALSGSTETDTQFVLSKGGAHFAFRFYQDWLYVVPSLVKPTTTWNSQSMASWCYGGSNKIQYPVKNLHLFANDGAIGIVMEVTTDCYVHMNFGFVTKIGSWPGVGAFAVGIGQDTWPSGWSVITTPSNLWDANFYYLNGILTNPIYNGGNRVSGACYGGVIDINGGTAAFAYNNSGNPSNPVTYFAYNMIMHSSIPVFSYVNTYNGRMTLGTPYYGVRLRTGQTTDPWIPAFMLPHMAITNMGDKTGNEIINNNWRVYPMSQKKTRPAVGNGGQATGDFAFAYKV